jgi:hypothetical protein
MRGAEKATIDHETIRNWVEARGGQPAAVQGTGDRGDPGVLRIGFPGDRGEEPLAWLPWDDWFEKFDEAELSFRYEDVEDSSFYELVYRAAAG